MATRNVNLTGMLEIMGVGARRASAFMALGLRASDSDRISSFKIDTNFLYQFMDDPVSDAVAIEVRANFSKWIIGNGLRELDQHFSMFLDELYPALLGISNGAKVPDDFDSRMKSFTQVTNSSSKLSKLDNQFRIRSSAIQHISSLSRVRNSFTHNLGRVSERHRNSDAGLLISWQGMELTVGTKVIDGKFEPVHVEAGTEVSFGFIDRNKLIEIGNVIELSPQELSEICMTYYFQSKELIGKTIEFARENKVLVNEGTS